MGNLTRWVFATVLAAPLVAGAVPVLNVQDGVLYGASGIDVGGALYDVEFVEGTCEALFGGCDEVDDFAFQTAADANAASQALLDSVLLGAFDTDPSLIFGCADPFACAVATPFDPDPAGIAVITALADNQSIGSDGVANIFIRIDDDSSASPLFVDFVWARWSASTTVAAPGTLPLLAVAAAAMAWQRRRASRRHAASA